MTRLGPTNIAKIEFSAFATFEVLLATIDAGMYLKKIKHFYAFFQTTLSGLCAYAETLKTLVRLAS